LIDPFIEIVTNGLLIISLKGECNEAASNVPKMRTISLSVIIPTGFSGLLTTFVNYDHLPKKAPYMNPNERRVNQQIKSDVCANRFYQYIEELKDQVSEYLDKHFGRWC
jgi:hypothetical protein